MRVLMISTFPPRRCGIGDYTADLAFAMSRLGGVQLRVLTYPDGVKTPLSQEYGIELSRRLGQKPVVESLASDIESFKPDLVHLQSSSFLHRPVVNRSIIRASPGPLVTTAHDTPRSRRVFYTIPSLRKLYRKSARVIVHSPSVSRILIEAHGVEEAKIVKIPHGVDVNTYSPNAPQEETRKRYGLTDERFVLFFGFLRPGKGVETLLESWRIIESSVPDTLLVVAGGTPSSARSYFFNLRNEADYPTTLIELAKSLGIERRVRFTGYVPDRLVPGLLTSAAAIVLPYEGPFSQSGPLHKTLAAGTPLVASKVPGTVELLEDGTTALLCPPRDARALANAIYRVLTDGQLAERLSQNARRMAEQQMDWGILARATFALYSSVVDGA